MKTWSGRGDREQQRESNQVHPTEAVSHPEAGSHPEAVQPIGEAVPVTPEGKASGGSTPERLDVYLIRNNLTSSRERAKDEICKGNVLVNGQPVLKPGYKLKSTDGVVFQGDKFPYVSRGAVKLLFALEAFAIPVENRNCLDIGASTGGFTEVLLEKGARSVTAADVGHGQLADSLRQNPRVRNIEGINFKHPEAVFQAFPDETFEVIVCDVSFISITLLAESIRGLMTKQSQGILLIKPQFEAGRGSLNSQGVVTKQKDHLRVLNKIIDFFQTHQFRVNQILASPIRGGDGNIEYLMHINLISGDNLSSEGISRGEITGDAVSRENISGERLMDVVNKAFGEN